MAENCQVKSNCKTGYTRDKLNKIARNCGLNAGDYKNKDELCKAIINAVRKSGGSPTKVHRGRPAKGVAPKKKVAKAPAPKKKVSKAPAKSHILVKQNLEVLKMTQLREIGKKYGVKDRSKANLIKKIVDAQRKKTKVSEIHVSPNGRMKTKKIAKKKKSPAKPKGLEAHFEAMNGNDLIDECYDRDLGDRCEELDRKDLIDLLVSYESLICKHDTCGLDKICNVDTGTCRKKTKTGFWGQKSLQKKLGGEFLYDEETGLVGKRSVVNEHRRVMGLEPLGVSKPPSPVKEKVSKKVAHHCASKSKRHEVCKSDEICLYDSKSKSGSCVLRSDHKPSPNKWRLELPGGRVILGSKEAMEKLKKSLGGKLKRDAPRKVTFEVLEEVPFALPEEELPQPGSPVKSPMKKLVVPEELVFEEVVHPPTPPPVRREHPKKKKAHVATPPVVAPSPKKTKVMKEEPAVGATRKDIQNYFKKCIEGLH